MNNTIIAVIGGDTRQSYLIPFLENAGFAVSAYGVKDYDKNKELLDDALQNAKTVVLPYPVSPDGVYLNSVVNGSGIKLDTLFDAISKANIKKVICGAFKPSAYAMASEKGIEVYDYGKSEALMLKNALCTAEGAIEIAMRELPINVHASKCAVIGYGRIGRLLSQRLIALGASVTVFARKSEAIAAAQTEMARAMHLSKMSNELGDTDVIFNTAPSLVLDQHVLLNLKRDVLIIDLASSPGGVDFNKVHELGIKVIWALSLPGKCSPKSAGIIIGEEILSHLKEEDGI